MTPRMMASSPIPKAFKISELPATGRLVGCAGCGVEAATACPGAEHESLVMFVSRRHLRPLEVSTQIWLLDLQSELLTQTSLHPKTGDGTGDGVRTLH